MTTVPSLNDVFDVLKASAHDASSRGAVLYGAQAKKQLLRVFPGFTERDYGFKKFVDLLQAGHEQAWFTLETVDGHPRLTGAEAASHDVTMPTVWLKPDLWSTLLTWDTGERHWDRKRDRAVFVPTDSDGNALWVASPEDFVDIDPVTMEDQFRWMREFATSQPEETRTALHGAMEDPAPGAFKRALGRLHLQQGWTTYLRQQVAEHAAGWAARNDVAVGSIVDVRGKAPAAHPTPAATQPAAANGGAGSVEEELRARLHRVIDQMSIAELAALPVPAIYLIAR